MIVFADEKIVSQPINLATKYQEWKKVAESGDIDSQYEIFHFVAKNRPLLDEKLSEAFGFLIQAGEAGHVEAQFTIGSMYQTGHLLDENSDVALGWLLEAAKKGHKKKLSYS
ncbi:tetratricopeptide repeat protein [Thalassotalea piscium]